MVTLLVAPAVRAFDVSRRKIPLEEIVSGGPPKDGIPALRSPKFVPVEKATFLARDDEVVGLVVQGEARAYPIRILNWHEVVNDQIAGRPVAVTYCPLTGSAVVFDRRVGENVLTFGVSGKLYQSNGLMYDHQTESLWSQLAQEAVTGERMGTRLQAVVAEVTSWEDWRSRHPKTLVLSHETGFARDYGRDPYGWHHESPEVMFPVTRVDPRLRAREWVLGVEIGGAARAYPLPSLSRHSRLDDELGGVRIRIEYEPRTRRAAVRRPDTGEPLPSVLAYWFAWAAFHPRTEVWTPKPAAPNQP